MIRKSLPFDEWPASDRAAWQRAFQGGDVFDETGPAAQWSEATRTSTRSGYGRWLGYLDHEGRLERQSPPEHRVTPGLVASHIERLEHRVQASTVCIYVEHLYHAIRVMAPQQDWTWLRREVSRLARKIVPNRKHARIVSAERLYGLGLDLMERAEAAQLSPLRRVVLFRDGLMIAFLISRPLRRRSVSQLRLGHHLSRIGGTWMLHIPPSLTKSRRPVESRLPADLSRHIDRYLECFRPVFAGAQETDRFWLSARGGPLTSDSFYAAVVARTREAFGFPVNPHLFRDCAATTIAIEDPVHVRAAAGLLGHADLRTTERYYNQARSLEASRSYQALLERLYERPARGAGGLPGRRP